LSLGIGTLVRQLDAEARCTVFESRKRRRPHRRDEKRNGAA
jgi:hypothetical protein